MTMDTKLEIDLITKCVDIIRSDIYEIVDVYRPYIRTPDQSHHDIEMLLLKLDSKIRSIAFEINSGLMKIDPSPMPMDQ